MEYGHAGSATGGASWESQKIQIDLLREIRDTQNEILALFKAMLRVQ